MSVYAISDIHGIYDIFQQVKNFLKPEDILYVLGDCGDRGNEGWKIIKEVLANPQMIYIKGNHEDILFKTAMDYIKCSNDDKESFPIWNKNYFLSCYNGGKQTFEDWKNDDNKIELLKQIRNLPVHLTYKNTLGINIELSHAGYTPNIYNIEPTPDDLLWNRSHITSWWTEGFDNTIIVHGHTPIMYSLDLMSADDYENYCNNWEIGQAFFYCNNHKINLDNATFETHKLVILNLDTFEQHTFL